MQYELLGVSRASLYYQPVRPPAEEVALQHRMDELYTAGPCYGSRRLSAVLQRRSAEALTTRSQGYPINRKRVQRYMREMGIWALCPGPNLSQRR